MRRLLSPWTPRVCQGLGREARLPQQLLRPLQEVCDTTVCHCPCHCVGTTSSVCSWGGPLHLCALCLPPLPPLVHFPLSLLTSVPHLLHSLLL